MTSHIPQGVWPTVTGFGSELVAEGAGNVGLSQGVPCGTPPPESYHCPWAPTCITQSVCDCDTPSQLPQRVWLTQCPAQAMVGCASTVSEQQCPVHSPADPAYPFFQ